MGNAKGQIEMTRKPPLSMGRTLAANRGAMRGIEMSTDGIFPRKNPVPAKLINEPTLRKRTFAEQKVINATVRGEADVQREILSYLKTKMRGVNPLIVKVERHNSGALPNANGRYVKFNRVMAANREDVRMPDITCQMRDGRQLAIEVKEPNWVEPDFEVLQAIEDSGKVLSEKHSREMGQHRYLMIVRSAGGIGIFATDVQDVINALKGEA